MRLVSVTVENFRSITNARKIPIGETTVLIGPNNEGKSNLLRALFIGIKELEAHALPSERSRHFYTRLARRSLLREFAQEYRWETDFPLALQQKESKKRSIITLEFDLNSQEIIDFKKNIGSNINGTLPISVSFEKIK